MFGALRSCRGTLGSGQSWSRLSSFYSSDNSTIYALATGGIRSALGVIRVSGPDCAHVLQQIMRLESKSKFPKARTATLRKLYDPQSTRMIDQGIVLWFPGPHSYTAEDCCEFHVHGGPAVINGLLRAIGKLPGCRGAEAGEFTKRAFLNGKMDLTEVDGLADLIAAESEMQRVQALNQMGGALSRIYHLWTDRLAKCLAHCEAFIDFGEDENLEDETMESVIREVEVLIQEISRHLDDKRRGEKLRSGVRVAIVGRPNVGKSTLLNLLCGREAAIVSAVPGTTRDVIETFVSVRGYPVVFVDTAGIRELPETSETQDLIETEGMRRSIREIQQADLVMVLVDISKLDEINLNSPDFKYELLQELLATSVHQEATEPRSPPDATDLTFLKDCVSKMITVANKLDLADIHTKYSFDLDCKISCRTKQGLEEMDQLIMTKVAEICKEPLVDSPHVTQERYRGQLENCLDNLIHFCKFEDLHSSSDLALRTHCLKRGISSLGLITGNVSSDRILDIVFRDFCIGK